MIGNTHESVSDCKRPPPGKKAAIDPRCGWSAPSSRQRPRPPTVNDVFSEGKTLAGVMAVFCMLAALVRRRSCASFAAHTGRAPAPAASRGRCSPLPEESLTFDQLQTVAFLRQSASNSSRCAHRQRIPAESEDRLGKSHGEDCICPRARLVQWVCASCGAKNRARRGGPMRCKYCHQPRGQ